MNQIKMFLISINYNLIRNAANYRFEPSRRQIHIKDEIESILAYGRLYL